MAEIWAVLEHTENTLHEQSGELLSEAVEIARRQPEPTTVCAILLQAPDVASPDKAILSTVGVQQLSILEHPQLAYFSTEGYVSALVWSIQQHNPLLVITSATPNGRDFMPRLAAHLQLPFASSCLGLDLHDDALFALRSIYEGRAYIQTRTLLHGRTALATLVPGVRGVSTKTRENTDASLTVTRYTPEIAQTQGRERIRRIRVQAPSPEEVELDAAERIIAGGRGIGQEGFNSIATFARHLGAAVGATRVATDQGWVEHARQIGATGKIVRPKLYIACGISGAAQHTSGMSESQTVVVINPDRTAPIFALADLGLLGDANQILPLTEELLANES